MKKRWFIGLSVLAVIALLLGGCQKRPTAEEIVAKLEEVEASTEDAHAVLELSAKGEGMEEELVIEVWEKKPNKFRAEILKANDQLAEENRALRVHARRILRAGRLGRFVRQMRKAEKEG